MSPIKLAYGAYSTLYTLGAGVRQRQRLRRREPDERRASLRRTEAKALGAITRTQVGRKSDGARTRPAHTREGIARCAMPSSTFREESTHHDQPLRRVPCDCPGSATP